jgi:hypothetical protein
MQPPRFRPPLRPLGAAMLAAVVVFTGLAATAPDGVDAASSTRIARCDDINLRTGTSTNRRAVTQIDAGARVTVVATVTGNSWRAICAGKKVYAKTWYKISAIGGRSVSSRYGVKYLYAATGLFAKPPTDKDGAELMRLVNLDRRANGKPKLTVDPFLVSLARGKSFRCPTAPSKIIKGRAVDMATREYFSHAVKGCKRSDGTTYRGTQILAKLYPGTVRRSEIIHWNRRDAGTATYSYGCTISRTKCDGKTKTTLRASVAQRSFMTSSVHRKTQLGDYTRFGCGSARTPGTNKTYFACFFTKGGP